jgi:hypothetical protein
MRINAMKWSVCGVMALGLGLLAARSSMSAQNDEKAKRAEAKQAIADLVDGKGDAIEVSKKYELEHVMIGFKLRTKGGFGVGDKSQGIMPDGIESKIQSLTKKALTPDQLKREGPALIRMLQITKAIGEVSAHYPDPAKKDLKAWKKYNEDMVKAAKETQDAVKGKDATKLKSSISRLSTSCNECHEKFRD